MPSSLNSPAGMIVTSPPAWATYSSGVGDFGSCANAGGGNANSAIRPQAQRRQPRRMIIGELLETPSSSLGVPWRRLAPVTRQFRITFRKSVSYLRALRISCLPPPRYGPCRRRKGRNGGRFHAPERGLLGRRASHRLRPIHRASAGGRETPCPAATAGRRGFSCRG